MSFYRLISVYSAFLSPPPLLEWNRYQLTVWETWWIAGGEGGAGGNLRWIVHSIQGK